MDQQDLEGQQDSSSHSNAEGATEGGDLDFRQFLTSHRQEMDSVKGELGKKDQELRKTSNTIERMRNALSDEEESPRQSKDPYESDIQDANSQMDRVIEIALEAERAGKPIPLTANLGVQLQKFRIDSLNREKKLMGTVDMLVNRVEKLSDPGNRIEEQAFGAMDAHLEATLDNIYGPEDDQTKAVMFNAVSNRIVSEIRDLKKNDPETWGRIRRDTRAQQKMISHFVKQSIPPRARQIMEEDNIRRTPLTGGELISAWREAKELALTNPKMAVHADQLRQQILGEKYGKSFGGGSSQSRLRGE